jgi:serine/threonine protein phosphatase 1
LFLSPLDAKIYNSKESFWIRNGGINTVKSFPSHRIGQDYYDWISTLPYYFEVEDYLLVHAGFNFRNSTPFDDLTAMLWTREWYDDLDKKWLGNRIIIHGHTPTRRQILEERLQNISEIPIVNIDCGCYYSKEAKAF